MSHIVKWTQGKRKESLFEITGRGGDGNSDTLGTYPEKIRAGTGSCGRGGLLWGYRGAHHKGIKAAHRFF